MEFIKPDWKIEAERRGESLPDWYNLEEAARALGMTTGNYLGRLAKENKIITYRVGKYRFMDEKQIQALMDKK